MPHGKKKKKRKSNNNIQQKQYCNKSKKTFRKQSTLKKTLKIYKEYLLKSRYFQYPKRQRTSLGAQLVKNLPAMQKSWVQSLGWEDPLEKGMAIHSTILAWRIQSMGLQRVGHD